MLSITLRVSVSYVEVVQHNSPSVNSAGCCYLCSGSGWTREMPTCPGGAGAEVKWGEIPPMIITAGINTWAGSAHWKLCLIIIITAMVITVQPGHIWINCFIIIIDSICHNICNARRCCRLGYQEEKRDGFWRDCWVYLCNIIRWLSSDTDYQLGWLPSYTRHKSITATIPPLRVSISDRFTILTLLHSSFWH